MTSDSIKGYRDALLANLAMKLQLKYLRRTLLLAFSVQKKCLCYNAVTMQYQLRIANDNNNDNDDLGIVGRSLAG